MVPVRALGALGLLLLLGAVGAAPFPAAAGAAASASTAGAVLGWQCELPQMRPDPDARTFSSPTVDAAIARLVPRFKDKQLATCGSLPPHHHTTHPHPSCSCSCPPNPSSGRRLFSNALPNALDTTVIHSQEDAAIGPYDTFIITGDIDAMWQRDSTNQAQPYLRFIKEQQANDTSLTDFFRGLIARQAHNTLLDPYANAFSRSDDLGPHSAAGVAAGGDDCAQPDVSTKPGSTTAGYLSSVQAKTAYKGERVDAYVG